MFLIVVMTISGLTGMGMATTSSQATFSTSVGRVLCWAVCTLVQMGVSHAVLRLVVFLYPRRARLQFPGGSSVWHLFVYLLCL